MTNIEMKDFMSAKGFNADTQRCLRGILNTKINDDQLYLTVKEDQNLRLDSAREWYLWYRDVPNEEENTWASTARGRRMTQHVPGTWHLPVWMKMKRTKKWHYLGWYYFEAPQEEEHRVIKRKKLHVTTHSRKARRAARQPELRPGQFP